MRKLYILFLILFFSANWSYSQVNSHAIGARFGGGYYGVGGAPFGAEFSYQLGLSDRNRLEFDAGFSGHRYWSHASLSVIFHWDWNIMAGWNWYIGPGGQIGFFHDKGHYGYSDRLGLAIGGQIGMEYDFNTHGVPILVSIDARPMYDFLSPYYGFDGGVAASVRYVIP